MRTDTVLIPRVVLTGSTPLTARPRRARRVAGAVLALAVLAVGIALAVIAGQTVAYRGPDAPVVEHRGGIVRLELPCCDELGTDAGLITTPAGDQ